MKQKESEYSNATVNNERAGKKIHEFSRIQGNEFSSSSKKHHNSSSFNKTETVNTKIVSGKIKKTDSKPSVEKIHKITSLTHAVSVTASVVAVAAGTGAVGFSLLTGTKASVSFQHIQLTEDRLDYALTLTNVSENESDFSIKLESPNYISSTRLLEGENEGSFSGLTYGEQYELSVEQPRLGGNKIYTNSFVFTPSSHFYSASVTDINIKEHTFNVYMEYVDSMDRFSSFKIVFFQEKEKELLSLPLEKREEQKLSYSGDIFSYGETYFYYLEYKEYNTLIRTQTFETYVEEEIPALINNVDFNWQVSFSMPLSHIVLDYQDEANRMDQFKLHFKEEATDVLVLNLEKTREKQELDLQALDLSLEHCYFDVYLTYKIDEEDYSYSIGSQNFINIDESHFFNFEISPTYSYETKELTVTLDYIDPNEYYSDFTLTLTTVMSSLEFPLEPHSGKQTIFFSDLGDLNPRGETIDYSLTYHDASNPTSSPTTSGSIAIYDPNYVVPSINEIQFDWSANFATGKSSITLDYEDPYFELSDLILSFYPVLSADDLTLEGEAALEVGLDFTKETQEIDLTELEIISEIPYHAKLSYHYYWEEEMKTYDLGTGTFSNTRANDAFNTIQFSEFHTNGITEVVLDYVDENDLFSNFILTLTAAGKSETFNLQKTLDPQPLDLNFIGSFDPKGIQLHFKLTYNDVDLGNISIEDDVILVESATLGFNSFESPFLLTDDNYFIYKLDYTTSSRVITKSELNIYDLNGNRLINHQITTLNQYQQFEVTGASLTTNTEYHFEILLYLDDGNSIVNIYETNEILKSYNADGHPSIYGITLDNNVIDLDQKQLSFNLFYNYIPSYAQCTMYYKLDSSTTYSSEFIEFGSISRSVISIGISEESFTGEVGKDFELSIYFVLTLYDPTGDTANPPEIYTSTTQTFTIQFTNTI